MTQGFYNNLIFLILLFFSPNFLSCSNSKISGDKRDSVPKLPPTAKIPHIKKSISKKLTIISQLNQLYLLPEHRVLELFSFSDTFDKKTGILSYLNLFQIAYEQYYDTEEERILKNIPKVYTINTDMGLLCSSPDPINCSYINVEKLKNHFKGEFVLNLDFYSPRFKFEKLNGLKLYLNLSQMSCEDIKFSEIEKIRSLRGISLPRDCEEYPIFNSLQQLSQLHYLRFSQTTITEKMAKEIIKLKKLDYLSIDESEIESGVLKILAKHQFDKLEFSNCKDIEISQLGKFKNLRWLSLAYLELPHYHDPARWNFLKSLHSLIRLDLTGVALSFDDLIKISIAKNIEYMALGVLYEASEDYTLASSLSKMKKLKYLDLLDSDIECKEINKLKKVIPGLKIRNIDSKQYDDCKKIK